MGEGTQSARALALWVRAEPTGPASLAVDDSLPSQRSQRRLHCPAFRHQSADLLSLVAPLRPARSQPPRRSFASPTPTAATDLVGRAGADRARSAPGISSLGQGQARRAAPPQGLWSF